MYDARLLEILGSTTKHLLVLKFFFSFFFFLLRNNKCSFSRWLKKTHMVVKSAHVTFYANVSTYQQQPLVNPIFSISTLVLTGWPSCDGKAIPLTTLGPNAIDHRANPNQAASGNTAIVPLTPRASSQWVMP